VDIPVLGRYDNGQHSWKNMSLFKKSAFIEKNLSAWGQVFYALSDENEKATNSRHVLKPWPCRQRQYSNKE